MSVEFSSVKPSNIRAEEGTPGGRTYYVILPGRGQEAQAISHEAGIYKIENILNGDCYIGKSVNLHYRRRRHFAGLVACNHRNTHLQNAFNKYGIDNFRFVVLLRCERSELVKYEQACVNIFKSVYNIQRECVTSNQGLHMSDEQKQKLSKILKGRKMPAEAVRLVAAANRGKKRSAQHKAAISQRLIGNQYTKGHVLSDEHKQKLSKALKGRTQSEEHTRNAALARIGSKRSEESRRRMSEAAKKRKRYPLSEEHKRKLSEALIGNKRFVGHVPWNKGKKMPRKVQQDEC